MFVVSVLCSQVCESIENAKYLEALPSKPTHCKSFIQCCFNVMRNWVHVILVRVSMLIPVLKSPKGLLAIARLKLFMKLAIFLRQKQLHIIDRMVFYYYIC